MAMTGTVTSAIRPWLLAACGAIVLAAASALWWQGRTVTALRNEINGLRMDNAALIKVNAANALTVEQLRAENFQAEAAVSFKQQETEALRAAMRELKRRAQEAMHREATYDARLAPDVADALCLQYQAANRYAIQGDTGSPTVVADSGAADSPAAGCGRWRQLTVRNALGWSGLLLERIGEDAGSFRAINAWREGGSDMGKETECRP